ncbi:MAG: Epimerase family protein [Chroococcopsis gigantea SAG 12.99]|jgi:uncharacterized protein (TIGR01777 family)|nr:TIGR01777 family oxidoreductase [Chlorogloea purpurea SAG 13.99]MDV3001493.1 Epimerase family protein [Chroococcopsis gigantea SAG 12.99]
MKVVITGGTGFVGTGLVRKLHELGNQITILTRNPEKAKRLFPESIYPGVSVTAYKIGELTPLKTSLEGADAVINLAGEPISERWTTEYKEAILKSREGVTADLVAAISQLENKPETMISGSAIGYYGTSETATFDENSPAGEDFLAKVCQTWEMSAQKVRESGVRLVILRIGIVLGNGGALAKMIPPFKIYAGGPIGSGRQWFSWISREDLIDLIIYCVGHPEVSGTYNATAPNPVRMKELCQILGDVLGRPSWLPVPDFALELLLGEGAKVVLEGQQVLPSATLNTGFTYKYPTLKPALENIIDKM